MCDHKKGEIMKTFLTESSPPEIRPNIEELSLGTLQVILKRGYYLSEEEKLFIELRLKQWANTG